MTATNPNHQLGDYLRKRLEYLEQCNVEFNSRLDDQRLELNRNLGDGTYRKDDSEVSRIRHRLEYVLPNTFAYTMLVGLCSFLEEGIREITKRLVCDYDTKIKAEKGNWLARHIRVLGRVPGMDLHSIDGDLRSFRDLIVLRNCVVHDWGKVAAARDPSAVEAAISRIETADKFGDGFLRFGDQVLSGAITAAENIADHILVSQLNVSIT